MMFPVEATTLVCVSQVFDVELLQIRNCVRRKTLGGFLSDVVCE